jgi:hypothetical protein
MGMASSATTLVVQAAVFLMALAAEVWVVLAEVDWVALVAEV